MATDSFIRLNPISICRLCFEVRGYSNVVSAISPRNISSLCSVNPRSISRSHFDRKRLAFDENNKLSPKKNSRILTSLGIGRNQKWWRKELQPSTKERTSSVEDLVGFLLNAGDKLVIVDFFFPGCGGCRGLHPKICQSAEKNPEVQFLEVTYEEHKCLCQNLNVHVMPFFRFYARSLVPIYSFSCTNATIKKFNDALEKHSRKQCSIGETKGLEEKELMVMAANKDLLQTLIE